MQSDIAFHGGMGSGKSTAAAYLEQKYDYAVTSIAKRLKRACTELFSEVGRDKAQALGKFARSIDEDCLIDGWQLAMYTPTVENFPDRKLVVDDMRYPNEYWRLKQLGFITARVVAPEAKRADRLMKIHKLDSLDQMQDETENQLVGAQAEADGIHFDYQLFNDDDVPAAFYDQIDRMMASIEAGF